MIGVIWLLVLLFTDGDSGTNEYGPAPSDEFLIQSLTLYC